MEFLELRKSLEILELARTRQGIDTSAVETLLTMQAALQDINRVLDGFFSSYGLTQGRFALLSLLMNRPDGMKPSDLADEAGVTRATVTGLLDGLERDGLVKRAAGTGDKRSRVVKMTPVAHGLMEGVLGEYFRRISRWLAGVSGGGRRTLIGALSTVLDRMHANDNEPLPL
ncbi:MarR family transcriptional regulator [bacterium]|nr:MarR family transcriptional regulator [bacterium]